MKSGFVILMAVMLATGCALRRNNGPAFSNPPETAAAAAPTAGVQPAPPAKKAGPESKLIVTPSKMLVGTVSTYNTAGRFVVMDFPVGKLPVQDQVMFLYRQGLKVGEVKITGPERDHMTVADLIAGEAQRGDEVRDK